MTRILLVEDNSEIRENTAEILELAGYEVHTASNGKEGYERALQLAPDLVVCDIMMPVLDGYGMLHLLSKNAGLRSTPFIFLTAKTEKTDFQKNVLTVIIPQVNRDASYVNSKWEIQKEPFNGDVINSYNDGPLEDGTQMGPFYEIESSSPALQLKKGEASSYKQTTIHLQGNYNSLKQMAKNLLNVDLDTLKK